MSEATFTNAPISDDVLPTASTLRYEPLAPSYARTMIIEWIAGWLIAAGIATGINLFTGAELWIAKQPWIAAPYLLVLLSAFIWAPMIAKSRGYSLREKDMHYKSGIIWRKVVSLPFNRIQHVEMESGPLERMFKLTTLKFFTAGGGSADMKIPALTFGTASKIRAFVVEKAGVEEADTDENDA